MTQPGDSVELKTRRSFFLDCPADYKPGDKVNILLSLQMLEFLRFAGVNPGMIHRLRLVQRIRYVEWLKRPT
jgi:hypothetical protein